MCNSGPDKPVSSHVFIRVIGPIHLLLLSPALYVMDDFLCIVCNTRFMIKLANYLWRAVNFAIFCMTLEALQLVGNNIDQNREWSYILELLFMIYTFGSIMLYYSKNCKLNVRHVFCCWSRWNYNDRFLQVYSMFKPLIE